MSQVGIPTSAGSDHLPDLEDDTSKVVYPEVIEGEKDEQYVRRAVNGRWNWLILLIVAALCFGIFLAATVSAVDTVFADDKEQTDK